MKRVCVFCGSSVGVDPVYAEAAVAMGQALVGRGIELVYGGGHVGLMGRIADAVLAGGGTVTGVIPRALAEREVAHEGLTELRVVASMHERKALMASLADGFVALPGGLGTLEELFEVVTWAQLGIHAKPCGLLDVRGFFEPLAGFLDHAVTEGFIRKQHRHMILSETEPEVLLDRLEGFTAPTIRKWIDADET